MPVQFICPQCRQLLSVSRRKIGTMFACPRCQAMSIVPPPIGEGEATVTGAAMMPAPSARAGGYEVINELLGPAGGMPSAPYPGASPQAGWGAPPTGIAGTLQPSSAMAHDVEDLILVSRRAIYAQACLFLLVAAAGFTVGFWAGRGQGAATGGNGGKAAAEPVALRGTVTYAGSGDAGSVVLVLPASKPSSKLPASGMRPEDSASDFDNALARVQEAGGDGQRVRDNGSFEVVVPRPGDYCVLIISRHANRPSGQRMSRDDVAAMSGYFDVVSDLVGPHQYVWLNEHLTATAAPLVHQFKASE